MARQRVTALLCPEPHVPAVSGASDHVECFKCSEGGVVVLCDKCDRGLHLACAGLTEVPPGEFLCGHCDDMDLGGRHFSTDDSDSNDDARSVDSNGDLAEAYDGFVENDEEVS